MLEGWQRSIEWSFEVVGLGFLSEGNTTGGWAPDTHGTVAFKCTTFGVEVALRGGLRAEALCVGPAGGDVPRRWRSQSGWASARRRLVGLRYSWATVTVEHTSELVKAYPLVRVAVKPSHDCNYFCLQGIIAVNPKEIK